VIFIRPRVFNVSIIAVVIITGCSHIASPEEERDRDELIKRVSESDAIVMSPDDDRIVIDAPKEVRPIREAFSRNNLSVIPNDRKLAGFGGIVFKNGETEACVVGYFQDSIITYHSTYFRLSSDPFRQRMCDSPLGRALSR
jgi:hypothetical protein